MCKVQVRYGLTIAPGRQEPTQLRNRVEGRFADPCALRRIRVENMSALCRLLGCCPQHLYDGRVLNRERPVKFQLDRAGFDDVIIRFPPFDMQHTTVHDDIG